MLIHAVNGSDEFGRVLGGLTDSEFAIFQERLESEFPALRFAKGLNEVCHPALPRLFSLLVHKQDRSWAYMVVLDLNEQINPRPSHIEQRDQEIAACVRQLVRAKNAGDQIAFDWMRGYLNRGVEHLLERLMHVEKIKQATDLWLDGLRAEQATVVQPCGVELLGVIRPVKCNDGWQGDQPFEAFIRASEHSPALEEFVAKFGNRSLLASHGLTRMDIEEIVCGGNCSFRVRIANSVPLREGENMDWAFEFTKLTNEPVL
jgi:hypothetical protein